MSASGTFPSRSGRSQRPPRPFTFAEFGTDLKPYFTTYRDPERPSSFLEMGVNVEKESSTVDTRVGKYRKWKGLTIPERMFLLSSMAFLISFFALTVERLFFVQKNSADFTFVVLLLLSTGYLKAMINIYMFMPSGDTGFVFCFYYVIHGIFREHGFELFIYAFSIVVIVVYCVANYLETETEPIELARLVVVSSFVPPVVTYAIYLGWLYHRSKNLIFRTVGANMYLQNLCVKMYMFVDLLKFDLQLESSVVILALNEGANTQLLERLVVALGVPISLAWNIVGYLAVKYESRILLFIFIATGWFQPAYVTYKFINISLMWKSYAYPSEKLLPSCVLVCGIVGLLVHTLLIILIVYLGVNFGNALGKKVFGLSKPPQQSVASPPKRRALSSRRPFSWAHPSKQSGERLRRSLRRKRPVAASSSCANIQLESLLISQSTRNKSKGQTNLATGFEIMEI